MMATGNNDTTENQPEREGIFLMGVIVLIVGIIGIGAVIGAVVVFTVIRSRRNSAISPVNPGVGPYSSHLGYPTQQANYPHIQQPQPHPSTSYPEYPTPEQPFQHPGFHPQPPNQGQ